MSDSQRTHWEGCWKDPSHHSCALAEIDRLKAEAIMLMDERDDLVFALYGEANGVLYQSDDGHWYVSYKENFPVETIPDIAEVLPQEGDIIQR